MMSFSLWMTLGILSGQCFVFGFAEFTVQVFNSTEAEISENETAEFTCEVTNTNSEEFSVTWLNEENDPVSFDENATDYQRNNSKDNSVAFSLYVSGKEYNQNFSKRFTCLANSSDSSVASDNVTVEVNITIPFTVQSSFAPNYTCLNDPAELWCTFRGYPGLEINDWTNVDGEITAEDPPDLSPKELRTTRLYYLNVTESKAFGCSASLADEAQNRTLEVTVRDDALLNVSLEQSGENSCELSWNSSFVPDYVQAYQVRYRYLDEDWQVILRFGRKENSDDNSSFIERYEFPLSSSISHLTFALVMNECEGPMTVPQGSCNFVEPNPFISYETALIIVGAVLGVAVLILLTVTIVMYRQRKTPSKSIEGTQKRNANRYASRQTVRASRPPGTIVYRPNQGSSNEIEVQDSINEAIYDNVISASPPEESRPIRNRSANHDQADVYEAPMEFNEDENYIDMQGSDNHAQIYSDPPQEEEIYENESQPPPLPKDY